MTTELKYDILSRREKFFSHMQPDSVALFFAAPEVTRSNDTQYPYRQNSDFWYLTSFSEPEAVLVLIKYQDNHYHTILFNRKKDSFAETWTGYRLGQKAAFATLSVDEAHAFDEIDDILPDLLNGKIALYHADQEYHYADNIVKNAMHCLRRGGQKNLTAPSSVIDWRPILHEMRLFKSSFELSILREACKISAQAHIRAMQKCKPNLYEYQLESEILYEFAQRGARFPSYNTIVGGGNNACVLHYESNDDRLQDGQLVLIDAGCEYQYYAGDITRTFPINGKFSQAQLDIYQIVLSAQYKGLELLKPGTSIKEVNDHVINTMVEGLINIGIMQGETHSLIEYKAYLAYYMHGLGHWLGIDVHDVGGSRARRLEPGMVLTVEPGLYINQTMDVPQRYKGIGIRIEDNIVITERGNEVLTNDVPKEAHEIEKLMLG